MQTLKQIFFMVIIVTAVGILTGCSPKTASLETAPLRLAISPYQDIAMMVNVKNLGLEKKYGTQLELITLPWEDILPATLSAGQTVDIGFGSLIEYLNKLEYINNTTDDPLLFIYPAYIFKGGAFVSFNPQVPEITPDKLNDPKLLKKFLGFKFGIQKGDQSEMALLLLARKAGVNRAALHTVDTTIGESLLATQNGSLDAAWTGITQRTEALKRGGRVVLTMDTMNIADVAGFICKKSVLQHRRKDIESMIKMWFDCTNYVMSDLDHHTGPTLSYLKANASTQYTLAEYKQALTLEYFPTSIADASKTILAKDSKYSLARYSNQIGQYLVETDTLKSCPAVPQSISLK